MISHEKDSNPHAKHSLRAPLYRATMPTTGFFHTPPYTQQRNPPTHANNIMRDNLLRDIFMFSPDTILQASSPKDFTFSLMIFRPKTFVNLSLQLQGVI